LHSYFFIFQFYKFKYKCTKYFEKQDFFTNCLKSSTTIRFKKTALHALLTHELGLAEGIATIFLTTGKWSFISKPATSQASIALSMTSEKDS